MINRKFYNGELKQDIPQSAYNIGTISVPTIAKPSLITSLGKSPITGAIGSAVGQIGGKLIGGGLESGAGNIIGGLGSIASAIPGPVGTIGSAALGLAGGLVNRTFGSKLNQENINLQENAINRLNSATSDLSDFDSLSSTMASTAGAANFSTSFYGKDGWLSNKAKNMAKRLNEQARIAGQRQDIAFLNNAEDISANQLGLLEANYAAKGGKIHIKKENRGKFTDYCGGNVTSECIQRGLHSDNPTIRKRANFARNARKWHSFGGWLNSQGGDFTSGVTFIGNGGTHEENPFEGVQMGIDPQGIPNLVEQGEVVYNDYVFSNRIKVPKDVKKRLKVRGDTFAYVAKILSKESNERPNDPISKRGLDAFMSVLANSQEEIRIKNEDRRMNRYAKGGKLGKLFEGLGESPNYIIRNPYSAYTSSPTDDFDYSKWFTVDPKNKGVVSSYSDAYKNFNFTADLAREYAKNNPNDESLKSFLAKGNKLEELTDEDVQKHSLDSKHGWLHKARALAANKANTPLNIDESILPTEDDIANLFRTKPTVTNSKFGKTPVPDYDLFQYKPEYETNMEEPAGSTKPTEGTYSVKPMKGNLLRYAPIVGSGIAVLNDMLGGNNPDYSNAELFADAISGANREIGYRPIGNYLRYTPLDRDYYINKLNAESGATRRAILQNSGLNRGVGLAGILAADYNYGNQLGTLARQAEEYNQAQRKEVEEFNRQTNMFNSESGTKVDMFNAENRNKQASLYGQLASMRQSILDRNRAERSANLTNFLQGLGDLGRERTTKDQLRWLADLGVLKYNPKGKYTGGV